MIKEKTRKVKLVMDSVMLRPFKQNWHYEVISFDENGNEDEIPSTIIGAYRYNPEKETKINAQNALRAEMGIIRILKGKLKDHEYMFPLEDNSTIAIQCMIYGYLTYGYLDKELIEDIRKDEYKRLDLAMLLHSELEVYEEIMGEKFV